MAHDFIKHNNIVLVKHCGNEHLSRVVAIYRDEIMVETLDSHRYIMVAISNVFETAPAPIDEKNIVSDWIDEELLDDCTCHDCEYMGWFNGKHPVYAKILKNGDLKLRVIDGSGVRQVIDSIQKIFNASDNDIRLHIHNIGFEIEDFATISFYFVLFK